MTSEQVVAGRMELVAVPDEKEMARELFQQFYEVAVARYGIDSAQACGSAMLAASFE
jgi:hypothetical protein